MVRQLYWSRLAEADSQLASVYGDGPFSESDPAVKSKEVVGIVAGTFSSGNKERPRVVSISRMYLSETQGGEPIK